MYGTVVHLAAKFGQQFSQRFGLHRGAGKTIQQGAALAIRAGEPVTDHADRHVIRHQFAFIHIGLGQFAEFGVVFDVLPEQVAGEICGKPVVSAMIFA